MLNLSKARIRQKTTKNTGRSGYNLLFISTLEEKKLYAG